jgi:GTPase SAR1 family protein
MAERYNVRFFEVSAKTNKGITEAFLAVTQETYDEQTKRGNKLQF